MPSSIPPRLARLLSNVNMRLARYPDMYVEQRARRFEDADNDERGQFLHGVPALATFSAVLLALMGLTLTAPATQQAENTFSCESAVLENIHGNNHLLTSYVAEIYPVLKSIRDKYPALGCVVQSTKEIGNPDSNLEHIARLCAHCLYVNHLLVMCGRLSVMLFIVSMVAQIQRSRISGPGDIRCRFFSYLPGALGVVLLNIAMQRFVHPCYSDARARGGMPGTDSDAWVMLSIASVLCTFTSLLHYLTPAVDGLSVCEGSLGTLQAPVFGVPISKFSGPRIAAGYCNSQRGTFQVLGHVHPRTSPLGQKLLLSTTPAGSGQDPEGAGSADAAEAGESGNKKTTAELRKQIKDAGVAGVISLLAVRVLWLGISVPLAVLAYYQATGTWPNPFDQAQVAQCIAYGAAYFGMSSALLPIRIALSLGLIPAIDKYLVKPIFGDKKNDEGAEKEGENS